MRALRDFAVSRDFGRLARAMRVELSFFGGRSPEDVERSRPYNNAATGRVFMAFGSPPRAIKHSLTVAAQIGTASLSERLRSKKEPCGLGTRRGALARSRPEKIAPLIHRAYAVTTFETVPIGEKPGAKRHTSAP